jgi:hypothetical protein
MRTIEDGACLLRHYVMARDGGIAGTFIGSGFTV